MDFSITLVNLAGSVALLLWGVHMVQTGIQRTLGARLRGVLSTALRNRFQAFLAGIGITAILQSSTATGLMVTGFAAGGLVDLVPALAVMLGANVGTTLIVQVLSFNVAEVAPALILVGVLMFRRSIAAPRDFGRVLIGLGLMLMALRQFVFLLDPYEDMPSLRLLLGAVATQPMLDVILGAGLTWAAHSSVAIVLLTMSFCAKGVVPPIAAFALVLGANLGSAINPVLEGGAGDDSAAKRLPIGNLLNRIAGVLVGLAVLRPLSTWLVMVDPDNSRVVADFHTGFNIVLAVVFFPLLGPFATLLRRLLPARVDPADPSQPVYLDAAAVEVPMVALGAAAREALRMADALEVMLQGLRDVIQRPDRRQLSGLKRHDDVLDRLNMAIKAYVSALPTEAMSDADHRRVFEILSFATNVEHAGDVVDRGLIGLVGKQVKRGVPFIAEEAASLCTVIDRLIGNLRTAASLLVTGDDRAARMLVAEKEAFRKLEADATAAHFEALRDGRTGASALHLDTLRDLKRVNGHVVAAAAYPVLEGKGDLLPSRVR